MNELQRNYERVIKFRRQVGNDGKIFSVLFTKRTTGEDRLMVARLGVQVGLTGSGHKFNPTAKGLVSVYDMQKQAYRLVSTEGIREVKAHGRTFRWG